MDARLLPAFVVHVVVGADDAALGVPLVPRLGLEDLRLVDERPVVAEHALAEAEGRGGRAGVAVCHRVRGGGRVGGEERVKV